MTPINSISPFRHVTSALLTAIILTSSLISPASAHPLGQYTINHFARIESGINRARIRYVVDLAELAAFQELQNADADNSGSLSDPESEKYLARTTAGFLAAIRLSADGQPVALRVTSQKLTLRPGAAGLMTMMIECDFEGALPGSAAVRRLTFEDANHRGRQGWHELFVVPAAGVSVFDSTAFGSGITDGLKEYPEDMLMAPLNERAAEWSVTSGAPPVGSKALVTRAGKTVARARDRFAELIAVKTITPGFALFALLFAFVLGGIHALSPGHGKTVVGAYLVGSRGTAKHAAFLGLTVTITHTLTVYGILLVTLFASHYVSSEKLIPILSLASGLIVLVLGLSMFARRLRAALGLAAHEHDHVHLHAHDHGHDHGHDHAAAHVHSHGGKAHSHLPPEQITWRSLLALGTSGGLLPCPSALVVALSAIALDRVGFGLLLIIAFSLGLAGVLTGIGLAFVYAGRFIKIDARQSIAVRVLPTASALVIACVGAVICYEALRQVGVDLISLFTQTAEPTASLSTLTVLGLGLVLGLRHAVEADHLAAVTAIVSERKSIFGSSLVGGLWGIGHTIPLLVVGVAVILLRIQFGERLRLSLEFCVALMLVALGVNVIWRLARGGRLHMHAHRHGGRVHLHPHVHDGSPEPDQKTHHGFRLNSRPLYVGMVHGMAGSAALVPLVLTEISSPVVGFGYLLIFGLGSIGGMMLMSALVGLPMYFTADRFVRTNFAVRALAGLFSVGFGLFMVYEIGFREGLLR
ncbi:MAG TPA: hypothetical protein VFD58_17935 [Blastocatellia bacterium]|nr:hypothetical protein [Blastocatellia bacterium]